MKPPTDTFAQRSRTLASEVQRLRDWAGGDPARMGMVADALVALTAHRLSGHAWAEAAASAQEAVTLAAKTLALHGPVGPYTPMPDAVRSVTSLVHLAAVQAAAGLAQPAGQTLAAAFALREQLHRLDLDAGLDPATIAWALQVWARVALAAGEVAVANARADAAASVSVDEGWLAVDVDRVAADARWAAGWPAPSVEHLLRAVEAYDDQAIGVLEQPAAVSPALLDRLSEPLFGLYSDTADRLLVVGAPGLALTLRRRLVDLLGTLAVRKPELQPLLVIALTDLAADLAAGGRVGEAGDVADLAASIAGEDEGDRPPARQRAALGAPVSWSALPATEVFGVHTGALGVPDGRLATQRGPADAIEQQRRAEAEADLAQRSAAQAAAETLRAAEAERQRAEAERLAAQQAEEARLEVERAAAAAEAERQLNQRRRAERKAEHDRLVERERAEREAALRARVTDETAADRAEREDLERLAAELAELEAEEARTREQEAAELAELEAEEARRAEQDAAELAEVERQLALEQESPLQPAASEAEEDVLADAEEVVEAAAEERAVDDAERIEERAEADEAWAAAAELEEAQSIAQAEAERERARAEEAAAAERAERDQLAAEQAERATVERLERERLELARVEAHRAEQERLAAEEAATAARERLAAEEAAERERLEQDRLEAERVAQAQAEFERLESERIEAEPWELERAERERAERERAAQERAEQQRAEQERAEQERAELERAERERAERERAEQERAEQQRAERERLAAEEAATAERERLERERAEADRLAADAAQRAAQERLDGDRARAEAMDQAVLDRAREDVGQAEGRREVRAATELLVDELRTRYEVEPDRYLAEYLDALDQLASARWQAGDWWGSREPSKTAKALRKQHNL